MLILQSGSDNTFYTVLQDQDLTRVAVHDEFLDTSPPSLPIIGVNDAKAVKKWAGLLAYDTSQKSYFNQRFMGLRQTNSSTDNAYVL